MEVTVTNRWYLSAKKNKLYLAQSSSLLKDYGIQ